METGRRLRGEAAGFLAQLSQGRRRVRRAGTGDPREIFVGFDAPYVFWDKHVHVDTSVNVCA